MTVPQTSLNPVSSRQSRSRSPEAELLARIAEGLRPYEFANRVTEVRETRLRLRCRLRTLEVASPELEPVAAMTRQCLALCPRDPDHPSRRYVRTLRSVLERLESHRVAAAVYTCTPEGTALFPVHQRLEELARECGGSVCWYHQDHRLAEWPLADRPGWQRVGRLIQQRHIGLLAVASMEELIPPYSLLTAHPQHARHAFEQWALAHQLRLVCLNDIAAPAGSR
ncbi:hypothetical protein [Streptomyces sp. CBMA152]|uniref:hypothetical protein n=1 Tax=Streptomyces sp. CBMA152 TaxID=1896312 RepID=UPI001660FB08|nr:hypothetical protein [Streptomyces sp. CBMA152]MBD0742968.1 hypothetical protein [Streptomyces sp. CBMA152]